MARSTKMPGTRDLQHESRRDTDHIRIRALCSMMMLAGWRVRSSWFFLLVTGMGMVAVVMLVCAVPLLSQVALTAGTRIVLQATPESSLLTLQTTSTQVSASSVQDITRQLTPLVQQHVGAYLNGASDFSLQATNLDVLSPNLQHSGSFNNMNIYGADMMHAASHLTVQQGQLPQESDDAPGRSLNIAITSTTASTLKVGLGSTMLLRVEVTNPTLRTGTMPPAQLTAHIVGIFTPDTNDPFWQGMNFSILPGGSFLTFQALASNKTLLNALASTVVGTQASSSQFTYALTLVWIYHLDPQRITSSNLNTLIQHLLALQAQVNNQHTLSSGQAMLSGPAVGSTNNGTPGTLAQYQEQMGIVQIPAVLLSLQVLLMVFFFLVMTTELLVGHQSEALAILHSRGASRGQVTGAIAAQSLVVAVIALFIGPLLALLVVRLLMQHVLLPQEQSVLNILSWSALWSVSGYALIATLVVVLTTFFAIYRKAGRNVVEQRRELSRSTKVVLSQHLQLDVVAAIVALTGYVISQYVVNTQTLEARSAALLATPMALIAPIFLYIAALFLSLRFAPQVLQVLSRLAAHFRGAAPMLAFAQMSRSPRQFMPRVLLLSLTTALAIFTLVFADTQSSHVSDIAAYQTGADFSGFIARQTAPTPSVAQLSAAYQHIPGVVAAMVGEQEQTLTAGTSQESTINLEAVDTHRLVQTVNWQQWNSNVKLTTLLQRLMIPQKMNQPLPALTDAATWQVLNLALGTTFALQTRRGIISFIAVGEIPSISQEYEGATDGTVIVNYANYASYAQSHVKLNPDVPPFNYVWLRTSQNPALVKQVHTALNQGLLQLTPLYDRVAITQRLQSDPLYLDLVGILTIGILTALFLALLGNWLASWMNVQSRRTSFAALRALGTAPEQIVWVLVWEQGSLYTLAFIPGLLLGLLLAVTVVPKLVFTSTMGSQDEGTLIYALQSSLPIRLVFSPFLLLMVLLLMLACALVLFIMVRIVLRLSLSQVLRLNED